MRVNYGICNNKDCYYGAMACDWSCKLYTCLKHSEKSIQKMKFYTCGQHNSNDITKSNRGISDQIKEIIDDLVSNYDHRPKRIHAKLNSIAKKRTDIINMPNYYQVRNYINYKNIKFGNLK